MEGEIAFAVDGMLGRLGKYLRALGYDTLYVPALGDAIFGIAAAEFRILVTLRKVFPETAAGTVLRIEADSIERQIAAVFAQLEITPSRERVLTICLECNEPTGEVAAEMVADKVPANVRGAISSYRLCPRCGRVYWWGSHADRIMERLEASGVFG